MSTYQSVFLEHEHIPEWTHKYYPVYNPVNYLYINYYKCNPIDYLKMEAWENTVVSCIQLHFPIHYCGWESSWVSSLRQTV